MTDNEIVSQVLRGRRDVFRALVDRYYPKIFLYIRALVRDPIESEDLCQNAFFRIFQKLSLYDQKRPFGPWGVKIAHNVALRFLQERKKQAFRLAPPEEIDEIEVADKIDGKEKQLILDECIALLPVAFRLAFLLKHGMAFTYEEIGEILEEPPGTIKTWVFRGTQVMRKALRKGKLELIEKSEGRTSA